MFTRSVSVLEVPYNTAVSELAMAVLTNTFFLILGSYTSTTPFILIFLSQKSFGVGETGLKSDTMGLVRVSRITLATISWDGTHSTSQVS